MRMSNRETRDQSQSARSRAYKRLTPESAVLLLVDHQSGLGSGIREEASHVLQHVDLADPQSSRRLR